VTELARNDISRKAGDEKLAPQPKTYLYTGAREVAPELSTSSVVALLHAVEGRYKKARFKTIWLRQASHPVYQYPVPLPVHNQGWEAFQTEGGGAAVSVRVGSRRWNLALATKGRRPQFTAWKKILAGEAIAGELSIIGQRVTRSDHRRNGEDREAGGGRKIQHRVMIKMVAWFPKKEAQAKEGTMYLKTGANYLLAYHIGIDGEPKYLFAEHVKRWRTQHSRHVMRIANDMKYEKRWPTRMRTQIGEMQDTWVHKFRNRIKTFCHETSVMLAKFAERRGVATVVWDDSNQGFIDQFPWYQLKQMLKYKLNERGIEFTEVTEKKETKTKKKVDKS